MHKDEFDKLIHERLAKFELQPGDGLEGPIFGKVAHIKRRLLVIRLLTATIGAAIVAAGAFFLIDQSQLYVESYGGQVSQVPLASPEKDNAESTSLNNEKAGETADSAANTASDIGVTQEERPATDKHGQHFAEQPPRLPHASFSRAIAKGRSVSHVAEPFHLERIHPKSLDEGLGSRSLPVLNFSRKGERALSDEAVVSPEKQKRWAVYAEAMPFFNYNYFEVDKTDELLVVDVKQLPGLSFNRMGWRAETGIEYQVSSRLRVQSGFLLYSRNQGASLITSSVSSVAAEPGESGVTMRPIYSEDTVSLSLDILNVGWLAGMQLKIGNGRIEQWFGLSAEIHKGLKRHLEFEGAVTGGQPSAFYTFANIRYRAEYNWRPRLLLFAQPTFNYSFYISESLRAPVNVRPFGAGVSLGVKLKL